jgi:hypothetical protein
MNPLFFSAPPGPFLAMASRDYYPYPMHTPHDLPPRTHRRTRQPKPVERVDSGANSICTAGTDAPAFDEDVEKRAALYEFMQQQHDEPVEESERGSDDEDDEGVLGEKARDSIDLNIGRSRTWETKEGRRGRNRKSRVKIAFRWLGKCFQFGLDPKSCWEKL